MDYRCTRCQNAGKIGVSMLGCAACNAVYHIQCLGWNFVPFMPTRWFCPAHWTSCCRICAAQNTQPQDPQKRCFSCGSIYCAIHLHTPSTRYSNGSDDNLFACAYCLDENMIPANNKRKKEDLDEESSIEREKKRPKLANQPSTTAKIPIKEKKAAISVEMMNQIISSLSPSAPPLHVQAAPIRKKKRADICETPDPQLIKRIKDALVAQQLHQKDLADILEVSPSTISSYFNNKSRSNGWKDLETKLSEWLQNGSSGSGEAPSKSSGSDSPGSVPDSHSVSHNTIQAAHTIQHTVAQSHVHQAVIKQTTNMTSVTYESGAGKIEANYTNTTSPGYYVPGYTPQVANVYQQTAKMEPFDAYGPEPNEKAGYYTQTNYQAAVSGYGYTPSPSLSMMDGFQVNPHLLHQRYGFRDPNQHFNSNIPGTRQSGLQ